MLGRQLDGPMNEFFAKLVTREFEGRIHDREFMLAQFERRRLEVVAAIPPERLLVYDVREGWASLCAFLGVPVPETPFPKTNTREEMAQMMAMARGDDGQMDFERVQAMAKQRFGRD